ncbi:histidine kinase [Saccharothrix sp. BKS2]|uniref:sensor histidine kinase n=1 Tax=Saccharothrix sp. BKS2 TaxID=3064400 RepID=UPI0039E86D6F
MRLAPRLAAVVVTVVFCGYCVVGLLQVLLEGPNPAEIVLAVVAMAALLSLQLFYFGRAARSLRSRATTVALTAQALLAYLPLLDFGQSWVGMPSFFLGSLLLVRSTAAGRVAFAVGLGVVAAAQAVIGGSTLDVVYTSVGTLVFSLSVYGLTRLSRLVGELHSARARLAEVAVGEERLRFARDLHDLLGLSLSAITFKTELAHRVLHARPERAAEELGEILEVARRALGDVRSVAGGYAELSLSQECDHAEAILQAANVHVEVRRDDALPAGVSSVLATVLREAVTNLLRHSKAEHCSVTVGGRDGRAVLEVWNDGVPEESPASGGGSGIDNLAHRVGALGGELRAGPDGVGGFRLTATVPEAAADDGSPAPTGDAAPEAGVRPGLTVLVLVGMFVAAAVHLLYLTHDPWLLALGVGSAAGVLALQVRWFVLRDPREHPRASRLALAAQAVLVYLPLPVLGAAWVSTPGFPAGSALMLFHPAVAWTGFGAVVLSVGVAQGLTTGNVLDVVFNVVATTISGLVVYALGVLSRLVVGVQQARGDLVGRVVTEERVRFARDLHGLLGLNLSAIILRSELIRRLITTDRERAEGELVEVLELSRRALADVRSVARGYRETPAEEVHSAMASLLATEAVVAVERDVGELPLHVRGVLTAVLHDLAASGSTPGRGWQISVRPGGGVTVVEVVDRDDGRDSAVLAALRERVAELGSELTAHPLPTGGHRFTAEVPAKPPPDGG